MADIKLKLALAHKIRRVSSFIEVDLKTIKRLNQVFQRYEKFEKEIYILESINILKQLDNVFDMNELYIILCEYVDIRFHSTMTMLLNKLDNFDIQDTIKLKELVEDEDKDI